TGRGGSRPARGEIVVEVPQVRDACAPFTSKLFRRRKRFLATEPLPALVIGAFMRGLSMRDGGSLCEEAGLGQVSKSTASRLCRGLKERFRAFRERDLSGVRLACLFLDAIFLPVLPSGAKEGVLCAWGISEHGERVLLDVCLGIRETGGGLARARPLAHRPRPPLAAAGRRRRRARPRQRDRAALAALAPPALGDKRLIVRRVRLLDVQHQLFATWQHFAFITNRSEPLELVEREHREARHRRARHPRSRRPSTAPLSLRPLQRQRRLDSDRRARAQPAPLDRTARDSWSKATPSQDAAPAAARAAGPAHPHRPPLDTPPARPLAMARRLAHCAHTHPRAPRARLSAATARRHATLGTPPRRAAACARTRAPPSTTERKHRQPTRRTRDNRRNADQRRRALSDGTSRPRNGESRLSRALAAAPRSRMQRQQKARICGP